MKYSTFGQGLRSAASWSAVTLIAASALAVLSTAKAQTAPPGQAMPPKAPMSADAGPGHHGMRGHGGGEGMGMMGRMGMGGMPERMLWAIDATPEQRSKLKALGDAFQADMKPLREQMRTQRQKGMELFSAATLDKAAIEKQRVEHLALHERMSKRVVEHMTASAEVLTPAQRSKIAQGMKSRMEGHSGHRGWGRG